MKQMSKHFEEQIWEKAVKKAIILADKQVCDDYKLEIDFQLKDLDEYKRTLSSIYEEKREWLKDIYFGIYNDSEKYLDMHKLSAVVCRSILACKPFTFNVKKAEKYNKKNKKNDDLNWIIDNYFVNYKVAVNSALLLNLFDLTDRLKEKKVYMIDEFVANYFSLYNKEPKLWNNNHENFYSSLILNTAINDVNNRKFDYLGFATSMFQLQQYEGIRIEYLKLFKNLQELKKNNK